jgi:hypothetical protein
MSLPSSGAIKMSDINTLFNAPNGTSLGSYANKGGSYLSLYNPYVGSFPASGALSMSNFYSTQQNYFYTNGSTAVVLGAYNISTWSSSAPGGDTSAQFIWNIANANATAPAGTWIHFLKQFNVSTAFTGTIYINCDNYVFIFLNGKRITTSIITGGVPDWTTVTAVSITIPAGVNILDLYCENGGSVYNPAGLLASLYNGSTLILHTDSTWKYYTSAINVNIIMVLFSCRLLNPFYVGPILTIRRNSDNATSDFYTDFAQSFVGTTSTGGTTLTAWLNGATGYVTKWYDQSSNGNHATQSTNGNQPIISIQNGKWVINFTTANSTYFNFTSSIQPNTIVSHFYNNNSTYGSIITTSYDYEMRFAGGTNVTGGDEANWYYKSTQNGGTNLAYNNGASCTSISLSTWNYLCLSVTTPAWAVPLTNNNASAAFVRIGTDGYSTSARGLNGFMTEMICHNAPISTTDISYFYNSRIF